MYPKAVTYPDGTTPRICIIGAGFSGLCAAIQLRKQLSLETFTIFELNEDVGGTWLTNTYPGCACDVQSHLYSYSFELNPNWSKHYSEQPEIWEYLRNVAKKYDLYPKIQFNTKVKSLQWNDETKKWKVTTTLKDSTEENELEFDVVINGPGALRVPNHPEEFKSFKGPVIHSAKWNPDVVLDNKVIGLIGSGASAIQIVPSIAPQVKQLHVFQRKAPYVDHRVQFDYPKFVQLLFAIVPFLQLLFRTFIFFSYDLLVRAFKAGHFINKHAQAKCLKHMRGKVNDPKVQTALEPAFKFGCKRVLVSENYYDAFNLSHVKLNTNKITKVNDHSITTANGETTKIDVLILCTGFKVQDFFAPLQIVGRKGVNIYDLWQKETPRTYYGTTFNAAPNHFILLGPNTALGHNTVVFMIECQVNFTISVIKEMMRRNALVAQVKESAQNKCMNDISTEMKNTIWGTEKCGSWYANDRGDITTLWPESCVSYWRKTKAIDFSHFDFE